MLVKEYQAETLVAAAGGNMTDVVVARHVFWTLLQPEAAVRAWSGLLRPRGRIIVIDGMWQPTAIVDRALAGANRLRGRFGPGRRHEDHFYPAAVLRRLPLQYLTSLDPARNVFVRAGLTDLLRVSSRETLPWETPSVSASVTWVICRDWRSSPSASASRIAR